MIWAPDTFNNKSPLKPSRPLNTSWSVMTLWTSSYHRFIFALCSDWYWDFGAFILDAILMIISGRVFIRRVRIGSWMGARCSDGGCPFGCIGCRGILHISGSNITAFYCDSCTILACLSCLSARIREWTLTLTCGARWNSFNKKTNSRLYNKHSEFYSHNCYINSQLSWITFNPKSWMQLHIEFNTDWDLSKSNWIEKHLPLFQVQWISSHTEWHLNLKYARSFLSALYRWKKLWFCADYL